MFPTKTISTALNAAVAAKESILREGTPTRATAVEKRKLNKIIIPSRMSWSSIKNRLIADTVGKTGAKMVVKMVITRLMYASG